MAKGRAISYSSSRVTPIAMWNQHCTEAGCQLAGCTDINQVAGCTEMGSQPTSCTEIGSRLAGCTEIRSQPTCRTEIGSQLARFTETGCQLADCTEKESQPTYRTETGSQPICCTELESHLAGCTEVGSQPMCRTETGSQLAGCTEIGRQLALVGTAPRGFMVGYALTKKKTKSFIQQKLLLQTKSKGITLVEIDRTIPLIDQGPFDVILQKLSGKEWRQELKDYMLKFPSSIVLDPPEASQHLRNRQSMLQAVTDLDLSGGRVGVPKQLVIMGDPKTIPSLVQKAGLKLPLVVKPLVSDGSAQSHAMSLCHDATCLPSLSPPLLLQEFVNHGGVLFKVYVIGESVRVVRRLSLPDVIEGEKKKKGEGLKSFDRVSSSSAAAAAHGILNEAAEPPSEKLLHLLASRLRQKLGLRLFNMDIIREGGVGDNYFVIDINYFPGYGKMPEYELVFTDFLSRLKKKKEEGSRE